MKSVILHTWLRVPGFLGFGMADDEIFVQIVRLPGAMDECKRKFKLSLALYCERLIVALMGRKEVMFATWITMFLLFC